MFLSQVRKGRRGNLQNVFHYSFLLLVLNSSLFLVPLPFPACRCSLLSSLFCILIQSYVPQFVLLFVLLLHTHYAAVFPQVAFPLVLFPVLLLIPLFLCSVSPMPFSNPFFHFVITVLTFLRCFSVSQDDTFGSKNLLGVPFSNIQKNLFQV